MQVNENKGYDALIQLPDGTERKVGAIGAVPCHAAAQAMSLPLPSQLAMPCHPHLSTKHLPAPHAPLQVDLGYERVKVGPTSNFVGNHMTQGAIDLVQAQLEQPAPPPQLLLLLDDAAAGERRPAPPQLLHVVAAEAGAATEQLGPVLRQLQQYRWADAGGSVTVEVPPAQMRELSSGSSSGSGGATASLSCTIMGDSFELAVTVGCPAGAGGNGAASGSGQAVSYRLAVRPLHAAVLPGCCRCYLRGLAALPPCGEPGADSVPAPCGSPEAAAEPAGGAPSEQQQAFSFILPPTAEAIVVQLAKADGQLQWEALQASAPRAVVPSLAGSGSGAGRPDLAALRWVGQWLVQFSDEHALRG